MESKVIIGLCGSTIGARREALDQLTEQLGQGVDLTVAGSVRAPWRRGEAMAEKLEAANDPVIIAMITHREEAEAIEEMGGHVIHVEGTPSDEIPIKRKTLLLTLKDESRGRYTTVSDTIEKLREAA